MPPSGLVLVEAPQEAVTAAAASAAAASSAAAAEASVEEVPPKTKKTRKKEPKAATAETYEIQQIDLEKEAIIWLAEVGRSPSGGPLHATYPLEDQVKMEFACHKGNAGVVSTGNGRRTGLT